MHSKINNQMLKSKPLVFLSQKFLNKLTARKDASRIISNRLLSTSTEFGSDKKRGPLYL